MFVEFSLVFLSNRPKQVLPPTPLQASLVLLPPPPFGSEGRNTLDCGGGGTQFRQRDGHSGILVLHFNPSSAGCFSLSLDVFRGQRTIKRVQTNKFFSSEVFFSATCLDPDFINPDLELFSMNNTYVHNKHFVRLSLSRL